MSHMLANRIIEKRFTRLAVLVLRQLAERIGQLYKKLYLQLVVIALVGFVPKNNIIFQL